MALFSISKELGEDNSKFLYFLPIFKQVLLNPTSTEAYVEYSEEYNRVVSDYKALNRVKNHTVVDPGNNVNVRAFPALGIVVVRDVVPMHYYGLFSASRDMDIVVALYTGQSERAGTAPASIIVMTSSSR